MSANLNAKFEVGRVDYTFFNRLLLRDVHVEDQTGETLLRAARINVSINRFNRADRTIGLNQILLQDAVFNLRTGADSISNLRFIIDAVSSDDTTGSKWDYTVNSVQLKNSRFSYLRMDADPGEHGINFRDIEIERLNLLVNRIYATTDTIHFNIRYLNLREKSGFRINHFESQNYITGTAIDVRNLKVLTPDSRLDLNRYNMAFADFSAFDDFINRVNLTGSFNPSLISFADISYFAPGLKDFELSATLEGEVNGRVSNLRGNGVTVTAYSETRLDFDFNMIGLPEIEDTFIFLDLENLRSAGGDIMTFIHRNNPEKAEAIPLSLASLGQLSYQGKFTGFIEDFVAYGELQTELGSLLTDLSLRPETDNMLRFDGRLRAADFDAGALSGSEQIGRITFDAGGNGHISAPAGIYANLEGTIDSVDLFGYSYRDIQLAGEFNERRFNGSAYINDPNLILEFLGSIDLNDEIPEFDFSANVSGARLHDLNLYSDDKELVTSFFTTAGFRGNNIDNLMGSISLVNALFERGDESLKIENATLEARGTGSERLIMLNSGLIDGEIIGSFEFETIRRSLAGFAGNYMPSLTGQLGTDQEGGNDFIFKILFRDTRGFTDFFTPGYHIAPGSVIEGRYDPSAKLAVLSGTAAELTIDNNQFNNFQVNAFTADTSFHFISSAENARLGNTLQLRNLRLNSNVQNDNAGMVVEWDNRDEVAYTGSIRAAAFFEKPDDRSGPITDIFVYESPIVIADSLWKLSESRIRIDSSSYEITGFAFSKNDQGIRLNGKMSYDPADSLLLEFNNMNLQSLDLITTIRNFHIAGIVSGSASLSDIHTSPVFSADMGIDDLSLNNQDFGDMQIYTIWDNINRSIGVRTLSERDGDRIIDIEGTYLPDGGLIDFNVVMSKINLRTFDGYLDEVFANLRGMASGELKVEGNIRQPVFNGSVFLQKASFMVDYLQTRYNFTHEVEIRNNDIMFSDLVVYDINHNICRANGRVRTNYFRDFDLNIFLYPERFMALNTMERDNDLFYGRVNASGLVHISGPTDNIMMNISARTDRNTQFFIPLQRSSDVREITFINFTDRRAFQVDGEIPAEQPAYVVDLSGIQLNFDLDVTPDAEVQIIFDSKIGDIIRGRGNGSFKMEINTLGQFSMFGEYNIEQGDYLFTLQNVINKRFEIERGGRISWNGDPFDAHIDMNAVYRLRAPLTSLMAPFSNGVAGDRYSRRIPVECHISLKNSLMTPDISFGIELPTADPDTRRDVRGILNNEEKLNRQFLSLLVINNFLPEHDLAGPNAGTTLGMSATEASITTVSEFFSNQLSNWLSQLSRDVDFGVNWRPGDDITPDEVELALSTQLLNDRVSINGHVDVGGRQTNTSNIVGDFDVDIKLNRSGRLRLKAFTRANDNLTRPHLSPYTQGIGLFYREEFNNFDDLMNRYWSWLLPARREEEDLSVQDN